MSAIAVGLRENRAARFWDSTNGKKVVMAITGAIMFLFIVGHLVGNLQVYEGPDKFNAYGRHLRHGVWSMFQSVGFNHPRHTPILKQGAFLFAVAITLGFISIPVSVLAGWVK
jgi:hypothetical protein